jgi:CheY-like chemotaxis protein
MKNKKILLINDNYPETVTIQKSLDQLNVQYTLHVAQNGKDALDILMGSSSTYMENYARTGKVQPDIILLNKNLEKSAYIYRLLKIFTRLFGMK